MKQFSKILLLTLFLGSFMISSSSFAQVNWKKPLHFLYKGTMKGYGKTLYVTMGFYWDDNDGHVSGEYYYGNGKSGTIGFTGYYNSHNKNLTVDEYSLKNGKKVYTENTFEGKSKGGWYKGDFMMERKKKAYSFALKLVKVYKR